MDDNTSTLAVSNVDWVDTELDPRKPRLTIRQSEHSDVLSNRLMNEEGAPLEAAEIDVTVRFRDPPQASDASGVVAITNRIIGEYVLECDTSAKSVLEFVHAARQYEEVTDDSSIYELVLEANEEPVVTYEKRTFLVYSEAGELLRNHSLIPSGVEI